ncbi:MAG: aromatic ring-hydroxylating oxygenase subunit alpha, partial [Gemmatimonadota bacterium]
MVHADADWLAPQALETAHALPAHCYAEPAFHTIDRNAVFARSWQLVAHAEQVSQLGDHALAQIGAMPLLVVRGDDGEVRALHNVCRHRAGPLADCDGRAAKSLVCRYHGWTYALDGALRGAPGMADACDFDPSSVRLPQARIAQWQGLVFAVLADDAPPFDEVVAGIDARLPQP